MQRNEIMQRIIDLETEMFMSVNAEDEGIDRTFHQ